MYNIYSIVILILFDIPRFSVNDLHQIQVAAPSPSSRKSKSCYSVVEPDHLCYSVVEPDHLCYSVVEPDHLCCSVVEPDHLCYTI